MSPIETEYTDVSFEGQRGTGKTTAIMGLRESLSREGLAVGYNRTITSENNNPIDTRIKALHAQWLALFVEDEIAPHGIRAGGTEDAEAIVWQKFESGVEQIHHEQAALSRFLGTRGLLVRDRDLDTFVAYTTAELLLSNPDQYANIDCRRGIIHLLWERTIAARTLPPVTFYLSTSNPQTALSRSYTSRASTPLAYEMTPIQTALQAIVDEVFPEVLGVAQEIAPARRLHEICIDGKRPEEVTSAMHRVLTEHKLVTSEDTPLALWGRKYYDIPVDILSLVDAIHRSTGAAYPSEREVTELGYANCTHANHALVTYSKELGLGDVQLAGVLADSWTDTCPVHWVAIERQGNRARVLDCTPFYPNAVIGNWGEANRNGDALEIKYPGETLHSANIATAFQIEPGDFPLRAAFFVCDATSGRDGTALLSRGRDLLTEAANECQIIYVSIPIIRLQQRLGNLTELCDFSGDLIQRFPDNLVLIREVARLCLDGIQVNDLPHILRQGIFLLERAHARYREDIARYQTLGRENDAAALRAKAVSYFDYYRWIFEATNTPSFAFS